MGGGDSRLVDRLVARGCTCVTVLDISIAALERAQVRLGRQGAAVRWLEADVTSDWSLAPVDVWHDRAVFHFLTDAEDRWRYVASLRRTVKPGGSVVMATFAPDGPEKCSGLSVARYSPEELDKELGAGFELVESVHERHATPSGTVQSFMYARLRRR